MKMARKTIKTSPGPGEPPARPGDQLHSPNRVNLRALLSTTSPYKEFDIWLVGDSPLIVHAWSEKAKREMLGKQVKAVRTRGREARDPEGDFVNSLYDLGDGTYGFPTTGLKKAFLQPAHKDKGIAKSVALSSLWLNAKMVRVRPAFAGAICDLPLSIIYGSKPEMREDMVKIGAGLNKTATLAYRAQFLIWAIHLSGRFNETQLPAETLSFLIEDAGMAAGIGEWRNERGGVFGSFHLGNEAESQAWDLFRAKKGPLPRPATALAAE